MGTGKVVQIKFLLVIAGQENLGWSIGKQPLTPGNFFSSDCQTTRSEAEQIQRSPTGEFSSAQPDDQADQSCAGEGPESSPLKRSIFLDQRVVALRKVPVEDSSASYKQQTDRSKGPGLKKLSKIHNIYNLGTISRARSLIDLPGKLHSASDCQGQLNSSLDDLHPSLKGFTPFLDGTHTLILRGETIHVTQ